LKKHNGIPFDGVYVEGKEKNEERKIGESRDQDFVHVQTALWKEVNGMRSFSTTTAVNQGKIRGLRNES